MTSRIAGEILYNGVAKTAQRASGRRRQVLLFESSHWSEQIGNVDALPVKPYAPNLQNASGLFFFLVGYSAIGGGDIIG